MASDQTAWNVMGKALWDPRPTKTDLRARQLAVALGYPLEWRVVRTIETVEVPAEDQTEKDNTPLAAAASPSVAVATPAVASLNLDTTESAAAEDSTEKDKKELSKGTTEDRKEDDEEQEDSKMAATTATTKQASVIVDRIYAGKPGTGCDMWFHHQAAMQAAETWILYEQQQETAQDNEEENENAIPEPTPFDCKGGHMLPRKARFEKGDKVQVLYEDDWWDAKILRRKEHREGFRYQVQYAEDSSKQSGVEEELIRPPPPVKQDGSDPVAAALAIGLEQGGEWQAFCDERHHKWKIIAPDGKVYRSKKAALDAYAHQYGGLSPSKAGGGDAASEEGDPPWRTTGNEFLGRRIRWVTHHKVSARRTLDVEQVGVVVGWISETDVDKAGEPGFVSERTGKPARLYSVVFDDDPHHPYASLLVQSQDLEEYELTECLIEEEVVSPRPKKKARRG